MGSRQIHLATTSKLIETFKICAVFYADHFGNKTFDMKSDYHKDID